MHLLIYTVFGVALGVASIWPQTIWAILFLAVLLAAICFGLSGTVTVYLVLSTRYTVRRCTPTVAFSDFHKCLSEFYQVHCCRTSERLPVVFGRSVDIALQNLLDLIVKDLISPWLHDLAFFHRPLQQNIK